MRIRTVRALDIPDYDEEEQYLKLRHRQETDTPLKNRETAERFVSIGERTCRVLLDYIQSNRDAVHH